MGWRRGLALTGKRALVTGAASGIGRATALALADEGAHLVVCDRDAGRLAEVAREISSRGREVFSRQVDVADREAMRAFAAEVEREVGVLDILVNNAGVALGARFVETPLDDWDWIVSINLFGVIHGCHFFLPGMIARGQGGHVVNVSSLTGFFATEPFAAYGTTKYAVFGLSEALRADLSRYGIGVTTLCPGMTDTAITENARARGEYGDTAARARTADLFHRRRYGPERVAKVVLSAIRRNRAVVPVTWEAWLLYYLKRLAPGLLLWLGKVFAAYVAGRGRFGHAGTARVTEPGSSPSGSGE
ncbi:SDR family NAD(P)-dependent oxidoreductase [Myxococcaceae bacterium JPH2]|nr:SDR family NAD(P)-dependent oxidoreductase [Myxococcaceae bacterium JPH2]